MSERKLSDVDNKDVVSSSCSDHPPQHRSNSSTRTTGSTGTAVGSDTHDNQRQQQRPSNYILPLSMRLLRTIGGVGTCRCCCINATGTGTTTVTSGNAYSTGSIGSITGNTRHSETATTGSNSIRNEKEEEYQIEQDEIINAMNHNHIHIEVDPLYAMMDDYDSHNNSHNNSTHPTSGKTYRNKSLDGIFNSTANVTRLSMESLIQQPPCDNPIPNVSSSSSSSFPSSTLSPLVLHRKQSMMMEQIIIDYHNLCLLYKCEVDIGIITTLRYTLSTLRITTSTFNDANLLSLVDLLYKYGNGPLSYIKVFDLSRTRNRNFNSSTNMFFQQRSPFYVVPTVSSSSSVSSSNSWGISTRGKATMINTGFGSHGAIALAKWIQVSQYMTELYIDRNPIGPYGASIIFIACTMNKSLRKLSVRRCHINERGAIMFVQSIITNKQQQLKSLLQPHQQQQQQQQQELYQDDDDSTTATNTNTNHNSSSSNDHQSTSTTSNNNSNYCNLEMIDISANRIGYRGCIAIEVAMNLYHSTYLQLQQQQHQSSIPNKHQLPTPLAMSIPQLLQIDMEGNLVLQEVMNSITHGLGIILAVIGSVIMMNRVLHQQPYASTSARHIYSCTIYSTSLIVLYTSSTLYHSFFTLRHTKYIFEVIDKCAIYILIAGSYTPFLQIVLSHHFLYSYGLLCFLWILCGLGVTVEFMYPIWKFKGSFSLIMFLCMGWSALICIPEVARIIPPQALHLMTMGGISYTAGVPFFVRNNNLDHAIWHLFVLAGSIFHWCGVYFYVVPLPIH